MTATNSRFRWVLPTRYSKFCAFLRPRKGGARTLCGWWYVPAAAMSESCVEAPPAASCCQRCADNARRLEQGLVIDDTVHRADARALTHAYATIYARGR